MKKSLIALAVLAASGAAFAQSNVTLYGVADIVIHKDADVSARMSSGGVSTSRWGIKGSEDLGGGLKATFALAQRFSPESGGNDGTLNTRPTFQGESTVGLSGGFGAIKLGRALTAAQLAANATDPWGTLQVSTTAITGSGFWTDSVGNQDGNGQARTDGIWYSSPKIGGFSVSATMGFKNSNTLGGDATSRATNTKNLISLYGSYADGPLTVGVAYEQNRWEDTLTFVHGIYNFGSFQLGGSYGVVETNADAKTVVTGALARGQQANNWNIMAVVPMGAMTVKAGYAVSENDTTGADRSKKLGLGLDYALSKRTTIYTSVGRDSVTDVTGYDIGIRHSF